MKKIVITHFTNPHMFWFKYDGCANKYDELINKIEDEITKYYEDYIETTTKTFQINDNVCVYYTAWNKIVRGIVIDKMWEHVYQTTHYIVWLVDYGFPLRTTIKYMHNLPLQHRSPIQKIYCGGLSNIIPAERVPNSENIKSTYNWSNIACTIMKDILLNENDGVFLKEHFISPYSEIIWCELRICYSNAHEILASDFLRRSYFAISMKTERFIQVCHNFETTKIMYWRKGNSSASDYEKNECTQPDDLEANGLCTTEAKNLLSSKENKQQCIHTPFNSEDAPIYEAERMLSINNEEPSKTSQVKEINSNINTSVSELMEQKASNDPMVKKTLLKMNAVPTGFDLNNVVVHQNLENRNCKQTTENMDIDEKTDLLFKEAINIYQVTEEIDIKQGKYIPNDKELSQCKKNQSDKEFWVKLTNRLTEVKFGNYNDEQRDWSGFYVQVTTEDCKKKFNALRKFINDQIDMLRIAEQDELELKKNYIVKNYNDNYYYRAQLYSIEGEEGCRYYRFFLVDCAYIIDIVDDDLALDTVYETTDEILAYTEFQTVHCTLAGIDVYPKIKYCLPCSKRFYIYAVLNNGTTECLNINSYNVVFFLCDKSIENFNGQNIPIEGYMVNEILVELGLADFSKFQPLLLGNFDLKLIN